MNISFNCELNNKADASGAHLVQIRCTQNRKHKRISTSLSLEKRYWDKKKQRVKTSHSLHEDYNKIIGEVLKKLTKTYAHLLEQGEAVTLDDLVSALKENKTVDFFAFAESNVLAVIKARRKLGTLRRYETVLNKFKMYVKGSLNINKVSYDLLRTYENYLVSELRNSRDTVSSNLSVIRKVISEAIKCGYYDKRHPFEQIQLRYTDNTKEKLTLQELKSFANVKLPAIPSLELARDFFMACFLAEGCRGGDMVCMLKENVVEGNLCYNQTKTGQTMVTFIVPALTEIFERYRSESKYLFPLLRDSEKITETVINSRLTYVNKYLKEVCKYASIFKKITTHCARHTFTDLALANTGDNIYQVQQMLGHKSVKTTEIYARNRVSYKKDSIIDKIWPSECGDECSFGNISEQHVMYNENYKVECDGTLLNLATLLGLKLNDYRQEVARDLYVFSKLAHIPLVELDTLIITNIVFKEEVFYVINKTYFLPLSAIAMEIISKYHEWRVESQSIQLLPSVESEHMREALSSIGIIVESP